MEAVKPKGPKLFMAALVLAVAGGVGWYVFGREPGPVGEPEDPTKVLLIAGKDPTPPMLGQLGFSVARLELAAAAAEGRRAGAKAGDDIDAALYLADTKGCGYVAFADAGSIDFGNRTVSTDSATIAKDRRYAVFSVGDFAPSGSKVTVDPNPRLYEVPPYVELLRALFEQDKLAATLVGENKLSIEAKPLFERVEAAVKLKGAYGLVEHKARASSKRLQEYVVDSEEATPKPELLAQGLERSHGHALANGSVLLLVDPVILEDPTSDDVKLHWAGDTRAWVLDPKTAQRSRCEAGDRLRPSNMAVYAGGSALVSAWGDDEAMVWTVDARTPGCALTQAGTIAAGQHGWGHANAEGKVARAAAGEDGIVAEIHTPDAEHPQAWPLPGCTAATHPIWLDATHVATACEFRPPEPDFSPIDGIDATPPGTEDTDLPTQVVPLQRWLYLLSLEDGSLLALPLPERHTYNPELWYRPRKGGLEVLAEGAGGLVTYGFDTDVGTLFAAPPLDTELPHPAFVVDASLGVRALRADAARASEIALESTPRQLTASPDGTLVAFTVDAGTEFEQNLAVYDFAKKTTKRVAVNEWARHFGPSFTTDGSLVFNSTYSTQNWGRATVAQRVRLP